MLHRIAPHLVVGLSGTELTPEEERHLAAEPPVGVILFARNVESRQQLGALTARIREVTSGEGRLEPLVMADHEGGRISVLSRAAGVPPSQAAAGRTGSLKLSRLLYRGVAAGMRALGVNVLLGPVADVNTEPRNPVIGTRSFGEDPARVAVLVRESVIEIQREKVAACIKHFPGHGSTSEDSHLELPVIRRSSLQLKELDRPPFGAGVWAGASMVMMGHIVPPEGSGPATYESGIIAGTLREELGFDGVVITDALEMAGARLCGAGRQGGGAVERSLAEILERSLEAGNDLLLFSKPLGEVYAAVEGLGGISDSSRAFWHETYPRLSAASARRVRALREKYSMHTEGARGEDVPGDRLERVAIEIARKSVSVVRDPRSLIGAADSRIGSVVFAGERSDFENDVVRRFVDRVSALFGLAVGRGDPGSAVSLEEMEKGLEHYTLDSREGVLEAYRMTPRGKGAGGARLLFLLNRCPLGRLLLSRISAEADIVVVTDWPYAAELLSEETTVVQTYGTYDAAAETAVGTIISGC